MSDIRFNQWLHQSGTGGVTQISSGHVGIGTTNPLIPVHSANTATLNVGIITANNIYAGTLNGTLALSNISGITGSFTSDVTINGNLDIVDKIRHVGDTNTAIRFPANDTVSIETSGSEALRIPSTGNVLIGTTTDSNNKVTLYGNNASVVMQNAATGNGASNGFYIGNGNGTLCYVWNYENDGIYFATNNTTRARILSGGEFAIGGSGYSGQPFSVQTSGTNLGYMQSTGTTRAVMNFVDGNSSVNNGFGCIGNNHVFMKDGSEKIRIDSSGNLILGATSYQNGGFGGTSHGINIAGTQPQILLHETDTDKDGYFGLASSILRIQTADAIPVTIWTNDTRRVHVHETTGDTTIETGNLVIGTSGKGISFAATYDGSNVANVSSTSELLDDYEEGTFQPILKRLMTNGVTETNFYNQATRQGNYTRIGDRVWITGRIHWNGGSTGSGSVILTNLPFTINTGGANEIPIVVGYRSGWNYTNITGYGRQNYNRFYIQFYDSNGSYNISPGATATSGTFYFSANYELV